MDKVSYIGFIDSDELYLRRLLELFAPEVKPLFLIKHIDELALHEGIFQTSQPSVLVFDPFQAPEDKLNCAIELRKVFPDAALIILSRHVSERSVLGAFEMGVDGYLTKDLSAETVVELISGVFEGGAALAPSAAGGLVSFFRRSTFQLHLFKKLLTAREIDVLLKLKEGLTYKEIAAQLYISPRTVNQHLKSIYKKMKVENRAQLMARVYSVGEFRDGSSLDIQKRNYGWLNTTEADNTIS